MPNMIEIICACGCGRKKMVRKADRKRGWGKFYSKSCKAKYQERRTGQNRTYREHQAQTNHLGFYVEHEFSDAHLFSNED